jgi:flagellar protein FliO/FliZ
LSPMAQMRLPLKTIGLLLMSTCPVGLSAQVVPYNGPAAPNREAAPAAYQADAAPSLPPPKAQNSADRPDSEKKSGGVSPTLQVVGSLAVVLGIFFLIAWLLRRASPNGSAILPAEAFEVLGRAALASRQQVHLLRCGNKLLLVCVSVNGVETLTEISDPAEVDRLSALCRQSRPGGAAVLSQMLRRGGNRDA